MLKIKRSKINNINWGNKMIRKEKIEKLKVIIEELKTIKVIKRNIKQENKFLQSEAYYFKLNNGKIISREKLIKGDGNGSAGLIFAVVKVLFFNLL